MSSIGQAKNGPSDSAWRAQFEQLVERHKRPGDQGSLAACRRLAPKLVAAAPRPVSWTAEYLLQILHGQLPASRRFAAAVTRLANRKPRDRSKDKLRIYVPVASAEERDRINRLLNAEEKRNALLVAAHFEEPGEE
ncbi:MAG: hypothetical protein KF698_08200 [Anaerolineales bacterium]|nr:hypothetical protein [Anaerolineales bacterium]